MIMMGFISLSALFGVLLSGFWYITKMGIDVVLNKLNLKCLIQFSVFLAALFPTIWIVRNSNLFLFNYTSLFDVKIWLFMILIVCIVSTIASIKKPFKKLSSKQLFLSMLDAILMEVPQRMMMQSFLYMLARLRNMDEILSAPITAVIWCISICIQNIITKRKFGQDVLCELLASFIFLLGIGVILIRTNFIGFTMIAHCLERLASELIQSRKGSLPQKIST